MFLTLKKRWFDVMVTGEKFVEFRKKTSYWDKRLLDKHGKVRQFQYVEFQCGYRLPLRRFKAPFLGLCIVTEHAEQWSNGETVDFKGEPYYAIRLGPRMGEPYYYVPREEKATAGFATPGKSKRRGGLDSGTAGAVVTRRPGGA